MAEQGTVPSGTYIAWLSNDTKDAIARLPDGATEYVLHSGLKVADGKADLVDCTNPTCLVNAIDEDEDGNIVAVTTGVRTGTFSAGQSAGGTLVCDEWTDGVGTVFARTGLAHSDKTDWTSFATLGCNVR